MKGKRRKLTVFEHSFIQDRAKRCCEYCKFPLDFSHDAFHVEHIIPIVHGGTYELDNLAFACDGCNSNKWAFVDSVDPQTGLKSPLFNPRKDEWSEHFIWYQEFSIIQGNTSQGRATVSLLKMNRLGLINIRKALRLYGVHPSI